MAAYQVQIAQCEAEMLAKRTVQQSESFLALVAEKRSQAAADSLRVATRKEWKRLEAIQLAAQMETA